ncbi:hypothetical protein CDD82_2546 [Ophiocordyceps australis]|uniref:Uncharacterized protein n=1 Tax=Ophiocordyceps australis TaxID=1399860 RepID=A0A2C5ZHJ4_9HYPO|nr:hypothetical protein CDD82_2546 [Ophiocordyceps australis]
MAADGVYDRWLKDAQGWAPESDWDPKEYYEWFLRLRDARSKLKETYVQVDQTLIGEAKKVCEQHDPRKPGQGGAMDFENAAKLFVRYIIAYHFYQRSSFEDLDEKMIVSATQKHLGRIGVGMKDMDVAFMLQKAADKVPLRDAVKASFSEFLKDGENMTPVAMDWRFKVNTYDSTTAAVVAEITGGRKGMLLPKAAEIPAILKKIHENNTSMLPDHEIKTISEVLGTDERVEQFIQFRSDPGLPNLGDNVKKQIECAKSAQEAGKLDDLLNTAAGLEKQYLSWERTIGPAVTAIRRLGKRSAGQDAGRLADYARNHQRKR